MKNVPFYANHTDNMRCMLAVYRSVYKYYFDRELSWKELIDLTGYQPNRAAWTVKALVQMNADGLDIRMIERFDYVRYSREGTDYLKEYLRPDELDWILTKSNILEITPQIPTFLQTIAYEKRSPSLLDLDDMLAQDRLVFLTLDLHELNDLPGIALHVVLVYDKDGDNYILHDPGRPPQPGRRVPGAKLLKAMGDTKNASEMTGFKLKVGKI